MSYIDQSGAEHIKEHLTLEWDFVIDSPLDKMLSGGSGLDKFDVWEARRYELVKEMFLNDRNTDNIDTLVEIADRIIQALKSGDTVEKVEQEVMKEVEENVDKANEDERHGLLLQAKEQGIKEGIESTLQKLPSWKPSEEQIKEYEYYYRNFIKSGLASPTSKAVTVLGGLLEDLKILYSNHEIKVTDNCEAMRENTERMTEELFPCPMIPIKEDVAVASRIKYIDDELMPIANFILDYAGWNLHKEEHSQPTLEVPVYRVLDALIQKGKPYAIRGSDENGKVKVGDLKDQIK